MSPSAAPPPPPPPPPLDGNGGSQIRHQNFAKPIANGDMSSIPTANGAILAGTVSTVVAQKKLLPPFHDSRNDLMKAIRDGK